MTPAARTQAAIELLDAVVVAAREGGAAADTLIARYFKERRYAGSKDRRAVRDLVYAAIRAAGEIPVGGRAALLLVARDDAALAATFDGSRHGPAPIASDEPMAAPGVAPRWLLDALAASDIDGAEVAALVARAPLDVRVNTLVATPDDPRLAAATLLAGVPGGLRLAEATDLTDLSGAVEVQDAGSQIVTLASAAAPGMTVVDLCAGAGGKTLALAALMANRGYILACDVDRARLAKLPPRAAAAGVTIAEPRLLDAGREEAALTDCTQRADIVLIDAPCSGTGTWRRNPEARWRITPPRLERLAATQAKLLDLGMTLVKPGSALVYIVCSLLDAEGADQIARFTQQHGGWHAEPLALPAGRSRGAGIRLTPAHDATDGFFVARLRAPC